MAGWGRLLATALVLLWGATAGLKAQGVGDTFEASGVRYRIVSTTPRTVEVTSKTPGYSGSVSIPASVSHSGQGYEVTAIGKDAFSFCSGLTSVALPTSLQTIGEDAFSFCSGLTSVALPTSLQTIGEGAFSFCSGLTSVALPASLRSVGLAAFVGCDALQAFTVEAGNAHFVAEGGVLLSADRTTLIQYPEAKEGASYTVPATVTTIGYGAFYGCNGLTSVVLPATVTTIGDGAFYDCAGLTSVALPASLRSIGLRAFVGCTALQAFTVEAGNAHFVAEGGVLLSADRTTLIQYPEAKEGTSYTVPATVTAIGNSAFSGCGGLTSVAFPASLQTIGNSAFFGCRGLTSVAFPASLQVIGQSAFEACMGLTSVAFPASLQIIGDGAFYGCNGLTSVVLPASLQFIGKNAFFGCRGLTSVVLPASLQGLGGRAFASCDALQALYSPIGNVAGVTLGDRVFDDVPVGTCTLYVPAGTQPAYQAAAQWQAFTNIAPLPAHTVSIASGITNGTLTAAPSSGVTVGTLVTLTATPATGYQLKPGSLKAYKTGDEATTVAIANGQLTMPAHDVTVACQFEVMPVGSYSVTVAGGIANGTLTATPSSGLGQGALVTLTATPAAGYRLKPGSLRAYQTGNESVAVAITDNQLTMPAYDVTVTCQFEPLPTYTVSIASGIAHGTLTATPSSGVTAGTLVTLTITPDAGYRLKPGSLRAYRTGDEATTVAITEGKLTMPAHDVTVTCQFEAIPYSVTVAGGIANGTLTATPSSGVTVGTEVALTATPATGYRLKVGSMKAYKTGDEATTVAITEGKLTMPAHNVTVTCEFEKGSGIDDNRAVSVSVYPNPFAHELHVEHAGGVAEVVLTDVLGRGVLRQANPEGQPRVTVATAPLEPGVYLVVVRTGAGHRATRRVVKE